jgi:hypothetical protein
MLLSSLGLEWGYHISPSDTSFWIQVTEEIKEEGRWQIGIGTFRGVSYSQYPALGILGSIISMISSLDLIMCSKLTLVIIPPITLLFYLFFIRKLTGSEDVGILSGLIFASNPYITVFNILEPYHYESLAITYIVMALYLIEVKLSKRVFSVLYTALIPLIAITHHWASYNFPLLILTFYILPLLYSRFLSLYIKKSNVSPKETQFKGILHILIYAVVSVLAYEIYVSYTIFSEQSRFIIKKSTETISFTLGYNPWDYTIPELMVIIAGHLILVIYGLIGLFRSFRSTKFINRIVECSFLTGGLYFFTLFFLYSKLGFTITLRLYSYFFAMFSPMVAFGMLSTNKKVRIIKATLAVLILLSSYSITGIFHKLDNPVYSQTNMIYSSLNGIKLDENTTVIYLPPPLFEMIVSFKRLNIPYPSLVTPTVIYRYIDSYNVNTLMKTYSIKYFFFYKGWDPSKIDKFFIKPFYNSTFMETFYKINNDPPLNLVYDNSVFIVLSITS